MNPAQLQTLARHVRSRLVDFPTLGETVESFQARKADDYAAAGLARYVAAQYGGGAAFLKACGLRPGEPGVRLT